jgi:hypothetical protein
LILAVVGCVSPRTKERELPPPPASASNDAGSDAAISGLPLTPEREPGAYRKALDGALRSTIPAMPEPRFWEMVAQINWAKHARSENVDVEPLGAALASAASIEDVHAAWSRAVKLKLELEKHLEEWERTTSKHFDLSDDRFGDLCAHIIGLGQGELARVRTNPELALRRAKRGEFRENFFYVFQDALGRYTDAKVVAALRAHAQIRPWDGGQPLPPDAVLVEHPVEGLGVVVAHKRQVVFARGAVTVAN